MPTSLVADLFISVDGFAGSDGLPGYFGYLGPDLEEWIATESTTPHTALMGRRTYQLLASLPEEHRDEGWEAMARQDTVVFSRTLDEVEWPGARLHAGDPVEEVRRLLAVGDKPLRTVGSLSVVRLLLGAGVVDRLRLMVFPLLAGDAGREPAFEGCSSVDLELIGSRVLDGRTHLVEYRTTGRDIPRA